MTDAQFTFTTQMQYENRHLKNRVEALESGKAYRALREKYEKLLQRHNHAVQQKDRELAAAQATAEREKAKVRRIWFDEVCADLMAEHAGELRKERARADKAEKRCERAEEKCREQRIVICRERKLRYAAETRAVELEEEVCRLKRLLHMNHLNSSMPSSADWPNRHPAEASASEQGDACAGQQEETQNTPVPESEEKTAEAAPDDAKAEKPKSHSCNGRHDEKAGRRGAKQGHKAHGIQRQEPTRIVTLPVPEEISGSSKWTKTGVTSSRQVITIRIERDVIEYVAEEYVNTETGEIWRPEFPPEARREVSLGAQLKALCLYMMHYLNVAQNKVQTFLREVTGGQLTVSDGWLSNLSLEFAGKACEEMEKTEHALRGSPWLSSDVTQVKRVTSARERAAAPQKRVKSEAISVCANERFVRYRYAEHKGREVLEVQPLPGYLGTVVSDCETTFKNYGLTHQVCLIHLLRNLLDSMQNEPRRKWSSEMRRLLQEMIHETKQRLRKLMDALPEGTGIPLDAQIFSEAEAAAYEARYDGILAQAEKEYEYEKPTWYKKGKTLYNRFVKRKADVLYFLTHPYVPYSNNLSERLLRQWVRKRRQAIIFQSGKHITACCDFLSFLETRRLHKRNVFEDLQNLLQGTLEPLGV